MMFENRKLLISLVLLFAGLFLTALILVLSVRPWSTKPEGPKRLSVDQYPKEIVVINMVGTEAKPIDHDNYYVTKTKDKEGKDIYEYHFNSGVKCNRIDFEGKHVTKFYDSSLYGYPVSAKVNIADKKVIVKHKEHYSYYKFENVAWNNHFTYKEGCLVELDIIDKAPTGKYTYREYSSYESFTPDMGYCFNKVKNNGKVLWETDNPEDAARRVVINKSTSGTKTVGIYPIDGPVNNMPL